MARTKSVKIMGAGNDPTAYINKIKSKQGNTYEIVDTRFGNTSTPSINNSPVATQQDIATALSSAMSYKGPAASASDLPSSGQTKGDTYIASGSFTVSGQSATPGDMIIWNGSSWDVIDLNQSGTITGAGASGQVALFDGNDHIIGLSGITYSSNGTLTASAFSGNGASLTNVNAATVGGHTVGVNVPSNAVFTDTTYSFSGSTNCFYVTPSGSSSYSVTIIPSISSNITGSGASGYIAKFNGASTITSGPQISAGGSRFLKEDGTWSSPGTAYTLPAATSAALGGIKIGYSTSGNNYAVQLSDQKAFVNVPWTDTKNTAGATSFSGAMTFIGTTLANLGSASAQTFATANLQQDAAGVINAQAFAIADHQIFVQSTQPSGLSSIDVGAIWFNIS